MRTAQIIRDTNETKIKIALDLDGGEVGIKSGNGFFDHMLNLFASHAQIGLKLVCDGDVEVDFHHSAEDIGIALGTAFKSALGDRKGICRYGDVILPMDEALILCSLDFSNRSFLSYDVTTRATKLSDDGEERSAVVGDFDTELVEEFFMAFVRNAGLTLHIKMLDGKNTHHIIECVFKAFAVATRKAVALDEKNLDKIPSTKGSL